MRGFTLLETILSGAVALIAGTFLLSILVSHSGLFYQENAKIYEGLSLNDALSEINRSIKQASAVAIGYPETDPLYQTDQHSLVLKIPAQGAGEIIPDVYDYLVVKQDIEKPRLLRLHLFPDPQSTRIAVNKVLTTYTEGISFSFLDRNGQTVTPAVATSVGVNMTVLVKTGAVSSNRSATTVTGLRNS